MDQETRLLTRAAEGETDAFRVLFEAHRDAVFRLAYRLTGALDVAEDVAQECFLGLIRHPGRFDARRGSLRQYLFGTVRNLVRQRCQASGREVPLDDDPDAGPCLTTDAGGVESGELSEAVQAAIGTLPVLQREALVLFEFEELSLDEIAAMAGCDAGTVKSRLHRARARLRRTLAPWWNRMRGTGPGGGAGTAGAPRAGSILYGSPAGPAKVPAETGTVDSGGRPQKSMVCPARGVCDEPAE
jgi:RNA polymerase sigma-70 factor (ECF subfamily)